MMVTVRMLTKQVMIMREEEMRRKSLFQVLYLQVVSLSRAVNLEQVPAKHGWQLAYHTVWAIQADVVRPFGCTREVPLEKSCH